MRHYVRLLDRKPLGASSLMAAAAAVGRACSLWRRCRRRARRGVGTTMSLAPMLDARELGYGIGDPGAAVSGNVRQFEPAGVATLDPAGC